MGSPLPVRLKTDMLCYGCDVEASAPFPAGVHCKSVHLYAHSTSDRQNIPEDLLFQHDGMSVSIRLRHDRSSPFTLHWNGEKATVTDQRDNSRHEVHFIDKPGIFDSEIDGVQLSTICSYLGDDLIGVIPSNYCFYFGSGQQCRFCEILPTFRSKQVEFPKAIKPVKQMANALRAGIEADQGIQHIAVTSGNIRSYDYTVELFTQIGHALRSSSTRPFTGHSLATLMPPDDFSLIEQLRESGFNKVYFPMEVYRRDLFETVCPGKHAYGYDRMLDALKLSVDIFGIGNVYTNYVYGIQSLDHDLNPSGYDAAEENRVSQEAVEFMLDLNVIPAFTLYHYAGYNSIGSIQLDSTSTCDFFLSWGNKVLESGVCGSNETVLFGPHTLSNSVFNDGYRWAKINKSEKAKC